MQPTTTPPPNECRISEEMLLRLGQVTGQRFDTERVRHLLNVIADRAPGDPLAHLAIAVNELDLRLSESHMPLSEAVWHAHLDSPIVLWCEPEQKFLIVSYASTFRVRLARYDQGMESSETISRARLAVRMGLRSVSDQVEVGLIHAQSPARDASFSNELQKKELANRYGTRSHRQSPSEKQRPAEADHEHHHMPPFRRFLKILRPERRDILLLLVFAMFSGVLYLALPLAVDTLVANLAFGGQTQPYMQALIVVAKILTVCLFLQATIIAFQYYVAELIQRRIFVRAAGDLAFRLPRVNTKAFDGVHGPELVNRFLDIVTIKKNTAFFLLDGINLLASSLIGMLLLALYHPMLMGFVAVLVVVIATVTLLLGRKSVTTAIKESQSKYNLVSWFEEIAAYPVLFKGPSGYEMAYQRADMLATEFVHARRSHFRVLFRQIVGLLVISVLASVALLFLGTSLVLSQQLTLGQLVASELIMSSIVVSLIKLGKKLETWYDTMAATDKLGYLFDLETEIEEGEKPSTAGDARGMRVAARDLGYSYDDGKLLFENKSFDLQPGDRAGLYGPQGSGVSTMLEIFFAARQPTQGHLSFDGLDSRNWHLESLRGQVQLLLRDEFVDGTIVDNLRLGRSDIAMEEVRMALEKVGMLDELLSRPEGLNLRLRIGGSPLSTRERISLSIARALVQKPRLLLIDELFDGLDDNTLQRLTQLVLGGDSPWTVVVATRMQEVIACCNRKIELNNCRTNPAPQVPVLEPTIV